MRCTNKTTQSTHPLYFLMVKNYQVQVGYGINWCLHVNPANQAVVALMGDKYHVGRAIKEPSVVRLAGSIQVQTNHLGRMMARVGSQGLDEIVTEMTADDNEEVLAAALGAGDQVTALRMLPVHPKLALLFLRGMAVLDAAKLVQRIVAHVPVADEAGVNALVNFSRVALESVEPR